MPKHHVKRFVEQSGRVVSNSRRLVRDENNLVVHEDQAITLSDNDEGSVWHTVSSKGQAGFNGQFTIDIDQLGIIEQVYLIWQVSSITNASRLIPSALWSRVEIASKNGNILENLLPESQFLIPNLYTHSDEERLKMNIMMGNYADTAQRNALGATTSYYANELQGVYQQSPLTVSNASNSYELRVFTKPLSEIVDTASLGNDQTVNDVGATLISCSALIKVSRVSNIGNITAQLNKIPVSVKMLDLHYQQFQQSAGVSDARFTLSGLANANVAFLVFVRRSPSPRNEDLYNFLPLHSYEMLNNSGENLVGGQMIPDVVARLIHGRIFSNTSYLAETNRHVYLWSWSKHPYDTWNSGNNLGSYKMTGSEVLRVNFGSALDNPCQIDVYAFGHAALQVSGSGVKKIAI